MFAKSIVAVALLAGFSAAQNSSIVDISTLNETLKANWCSAQQTACPELCGGASDTSMNNCVTDTLNYTCTCANGSAPGLQYYINTIPTFLCQADYAACESANAGDATAQAACKAAQAKCGTLNPANYTEATTSSSASSSMATATSSASTASGTAASTSSSKAAAPTMAIARELGTGIFAVGAAAAFGLMI